jgi:hypothetical protein
MNLLATMTKAKDSFATAYHLFALNKRKEDHQISIFINEDNKIERQLIVDAIVGIKICYYFFSSVISSPNLLEKLFNNETFKYRRYYLSANKPNFPQSKIYLNAKFFPIAENLRFNRSVDVLENLPLDKIISDKEWDEINERRLSLIAKEYKNEISNEEINELELLQTFAFLYTDQKYPLPFDVFEQPKNI